MDKLELCDVTIEYLLELRDAIPAEIARRRDEAVALADRLRDPKRVMATKERKPKVLRGKARVAYRDEATGEAWSGRGMTPGWLKRKIAEGFDKSEFHVAAGSGE